MRKNCEVFFVLHVFGLGINPFLIKLEGKLNRHQKIKDTITKISMLVLYSQNQQHFSQVKKGFE